MEESLKLLQMMQGTTTENGDIDAGQFSPLTLAYIGDSVMDLLVKDYFVRMSNKQTYKYHKEVTDIVRAKNQAAFIDEVFDSLSEEEQTMYKRGRNGKTHSKAKNASMGEYRKATGLEALFGYLYLKGDFARLLELNEKLIDRYMNQEV